MTLDRLRAQGEPRRLPLPTLSLSELRSGGEEIFLLSKQALGAFRFAGEESSPYM